MSRYPDSLLSLYQLMQPGSEIARFFPADMLEALTHIVNEGTLLAAEDRLPLHFRWHWKMFARTLFIAEHRRRGLALLKSALREGRELVLVLRSFSQSIESVFAPSEGKGIFLSIQPGHLDIEDIHAIQRQLTAGSATVFVQDLLALSRTYIEEFESLFADEPEAAIASVLLPWATWQTSVATLMDLADCIVLSFNGASPGLLWEVEELLRTRRNESTVLLTNVDVSAVSSQMGPWFQNLRPEQPVDDDLVTKLQRHFRDFPHQVDIRTGDLRDTVAKLIRDSRLHRGEMRDRFDDALVDSMLTDRLSDALPPPIAKTFIHPMEELRRYLEAGSIGKNAYELFVLANLVLGLAAAVSNFRVAAYASECLSLAYAYYARPDIHRVTEQSKPNVRTISERLAKMSEMYLSWSRDEQVSHVAFREAVRARHDPAAAS